MATNFSNAHGWRFLGGTLQSFALDQPTGGGAYNLGTLLRYWGYGEAAGLQLGTTGFYVQVFERSTENAGERAVSRFLVTIGMNGVGDYIVVDDLPELLELLRQIEPIARTATRSPKSSARFVSG